MITRKSVLKRLLIFNKNISLYFFIIKIIYIKINTFDEKFKYLKK